MTTITKEGTAKLALRIQSGDHDAFKELEGVARPLISSLSLKFSRYHHKLEYDDFYSMGLSSLYIACLSYNERNPSFLDYAKIIILREFWKQINYWNAERRNIFDHREVPVDILVEMGEEPTIDGEVEENAYRMEFRNRIELIIDDCYDGEKADILKKYYIGGLRVVEISNDLKIDYKRTHAFIKRGFAKIVQEYTKRYIP